MTWQDEYKRKLVTAEDAAGVVKSGDRVSFSFNEQPVALSEALTARLFDLKDVEIRITNPLVDYGWFEPGLEEYFRVTQLSYAGQIAREMSDQRKIDYVPMLSSIWPKPETEGRPGIKGTDVFMMLASPPDKHGYMSYGWSIWNKRSSLKSAKKTIVEVSKHVPRMYGDNLFHVSEVDYIVEHDVPPVEFEPLAEPEEYMIAIGNQVKTLVRDGDTIAIGAGKIGVTLSRQGVFDEKNDLGYHAENIVPGITPLVKKGIITGKYKTLHTGKVVCNNFLSQGQDFDFIDNNPAFELHPQEYVINIRTVAAHDNMVAINAALSVDFTGQIASESIGYRMYTGSGGQPSFAIGSMLSKGGRSIMMLRSTSNDGKVSRVTPALEPGTIVTVPRNFADYIVTEYGIACLLGKSQRERAMELVAIAHPDFRADLEKQAKKLFWP